MKIVKCPCCKKIKEIDNKIIISICSICQVPLETEVLNGTN